jgi:hypothetical protein
VGISNSGGMQIMIFDEEIDNKIEKNLTGDWREDVDYLRAKVQDVCLERDQYKDDLDCLKTIFKEFLNDLTDPEMYGWAVSTEVVKKASSLKTYVN